MSRDMDSAVSSLSPGARDRIVAAQRHWALPGNHALAALHGAKLGPYIMIGLLGARSAVGSQSFQLLIRDTAGDLADTPLALGLFNQGPYPAFNWLELTVYDPALTLASAKLDLRSEGLELPFFEALSALVPAGGHLMIEYDSPAQRPTARVLTLGYPDVTSPTGYLLFQVGCRSFKNWHISEGGREGPRKLQGFKPWNQDIRREKTASLQRQVAEFLSEPVNEAHGEWAELAKRNAEAVAAALHTES
jgi:hypothetical protein